jgi:diaminopimelate dehydrogenase
MVKMIKAAVIGYGNTGKGALEAITAANDMVLTGVVLRNAKTAEEKRIPPSVKVAEDIRELGEVDAALLCVPTLIMPDIAAEILALGICTVDSYDVHASIYEVKQKLTPIAQKHNATAVIAAGWDPGSDSVIRGLLEAVAPRGITYTNFGPGMSMGHTVTVKAMPGVKDALSVTVPLGTGLHRRMVYIEPMENAVKNEIESCVLNDPSFKYDDTRVIFTDDVQSLIDRGSGVNMVRKAASGATDNQFFEFSMKIHNPALTGQVMAAAARAAVRQKPGCYTMIEIPVIDLLPGEKEAIIRRIV